MMNTEDVNIGNIAYECGYNSISNFNKFFKLWPIKLLQILEKELWFTNNLNCFHIGLADQNQVKN